MMNSFRVLAARSRTLPSFEARKARIQSDASQRQANSCLAAPRFRNRLQELRPPCPDGDAGEAGNDQFSRKDAPTAPRATPPPRLEGGPHTIYFHNAAPGG